MAQQQHQLHSRRVRVRVRSKPKSKPKPRVIDRVGGARDRRAVTCVTDCPRTYLADLMLPHLRRYGSEVLVRSVRSSCALS